MGLKSTKNTETATLGAGCFWGVQAKFDAQNGVLESFVGYAGGHTDNPTYEQVCGGRSGHAEVIQIIFDPKLISYEKLLETFFNIHDPTTRNRQGPDIGSQYRSIILTHNDEQHKIALDVITNLTEKNNYDKPIVTEVLPFEVFYPAEEYHQKYIAKKQSGD